MNEDSNLSGPVARVMDIVFPGETNHHGTLFGGVGLALMDKVAFIAAVRHGRRDFVTASCERIDFIAPVQLGDIVAAEGRVVRVGTRSLRVETVLLAENPLTGAHTVCTRGHYNMVAVDKGGGSLPVLGGDPEAGDDPLFTDLVFPDRTSHYGSLYGGHALAAMAKAAFITASRHSRKKVVLASCRRVDFHRQVAAGELMDISARITTTGKSSMVVEISLFSCPSLSTERVLCGTGEYVMVGTG